MPRFIEMIPKKRFWWAVPVGLGIFLAYLFYFLILSPPPGFPRLTDYTNWLAAARIILEGKGRLLYNIPTQVAYQRAISSPYETYGGALVYNRLAYFVLPILPLVGLPVEIGYTLNTVVVLLEGILAVWLVATRIAPHQAGQKRAWLGWLSLSLAFLPFFQTIVESQSNFFELLVLAGWYVLERRGKPFWGGVVLALAIYKPQFVIVFGLFLLIRRSWRGLMGMALSGVFLSGISLAIVGPQGIADFIKLLSDNAGWNCIYGVYPENFQSWRGFFVGLLVPPCAGAAPELANLGSLNLANNLGWLLSGITLLVACAFSLAAFRREVGSGVAPIPHSAALDLSLVLFIIASLLATPHANPQELVRLILAVALLLKVQQEHPGLLPAWLSVPLLTGLGIFLGPFTSGSLARQSHPFVWLMVIVFGIVGFYLIKSKGASQ